MLISGEGSVLGLFEASSLVCRSDTRLAGGVEMGGTEGVSDDDVRDDVLSWEHDLQVRTQSPARGRGQRPPWWTLRLPVGRIDVGCG